MHSTITAKWSQIQACVEEEKLEELRALVEGIRDRVRAQFPTGSVAIEGGPEATAIRVPLADLMPVVHARDAAQAKMASIGSVNPRRGGLANNAIQSVKRTVARGLGWFVRDQIVFNRGALACVEALMESVNELNRSIASLGAQIGQRIEQNRQAVEPRLDHAERRAQDLLAETRKFADLRPTLLKSVSDLAALYEHRAQTIEAHAQRTGESAARGIQRGARPRLARNAEATLGRYAAHPPGIRAHHSRRIAHRAPARGNCRSSPAVYQNRQSLSTTKPSQTASAAPKST